jgi:hypothetical protein
MPAEDKDRLRPRPLPPPQPVQSTSRQKFLQKYLGSTRARIVAAIAFFSAVVGLGDWAWTVYQNTIPDVTARDSETDSTFLLPLIVKNNSSVFDMKDVELTCGIGSFVLGNGKQTMIMVASLISSQKNAIILAGDQANFPCDASGLVKFEGGNGIDIMGLHADIPGIEPMKIMGIHTTIFMRYETLWKTRTYRSTSFDWTCTPQACHWIKGPIIR